MSDDWIRLVPENPRFVPDRVRQQRARARFAEMLPEADQIVILVSERIEFFDCGANFECDRCPFCATEIPPVWWHDRCNDEWNNGFSLASYQTPCCKVECTLNDLDYVWPQAFARFALDAMNPNIGRIDDGQKREIEELLGTKLRVIYRHI